MKKNLYICIIESLCFTAESNTMLQIQLCGRGGVVSKLCPTLCNPVNCSPPGSSVHQIFQARILDWFLFLLPRDLPNPGIESTSPALQVVSLLLNHQESHFYPFTFSLWVSSNLRFYFFFQNSEDMFHFLSCQFLL